MYRDPFYQRIIEKLETKPDGNVFEACVGDLLRPEWPNLVPVPGGNDAGVDGAWQNEKGRGILIATTQDDVIGNVTKNLKEHSAKGVTGRQVLVVTSNKLSAPRCRNIEKRIASLGFASAHQPYTQQAVADRLYHNSRWLKELLGISGVASALSRIPSGIRAFRDLPLIGRDDDLRWLRATHGDRLLVGQPGIGKTFLCQAFVNSDGALFATSDDVDRLVDAIRDQSPTAIVVEDSHLRIETLRSLRRYRTETGANFEIVADCWPGSIDLVRKELSLSEKQCRELAPLSAERIVELLKSTGIHGPNPLLHQLVRQSMGCPGRAALLAHLCKANGNIREVFQGQALFSWTLATFPKLVGERAMTILAALAIGGEAGMSVEVVSSVLGYPLGDVQNDLANLALGGVVFDLGDNVLCVLPEPLRSTLVGEFFFKRVPKLPFDKFLRQSVRPASVIGGVIGAQARGAPIDRDELLELVEGVNSADIWEHFLWVSNENVRLTHQRHPQIAIKYPEPVLYNAPDLAIPQLLQASVGDNRPLNSHPNHPLRLIESWIHSATPLTGQAFERRETLWRCLRKLLQHGHGQEVCLKALSSVVTPKWETNEQNPGDSNSFNVQWGCVEIGALKQVEKLWDPILDVIAKLQIQQQHWQLVFAAVDQWVCPDPAIAKIPKAYLRVFKNAASAILARLAFVGRGRPGVLSEIKRRAKHLRIKLEVNIDSDYARLFPDDPFDRGPGWKRYQAELTQTGQKLADEWVRLLPNKVAKRCVWCIDEATCQTHVWPNLAPYVCARIANQTPAPQKWLKAFVNAKAPADLVLPFLETVASRKKAGWLRAILDCMKRDDLVSAGLSVGIVAPEQNADIESFILSTARRLPELVENACWFKEIPRERLKRLLTDSDQRLSQSVAVGLWHRSRDNYSIPPELVQSWRKAVISGAIKKYDLVEMFKSDQSLAFRWLKDRATRKTTQYRHESDAIAAAAIALTDNQRAKILRLVSSKIYLSGEIVAAVVGTDGDLYQTLLCDRNLESLRLAPLGGHPNASWASLAVIALDFGIPPEEIASTAFTETGVRWGAMPDKYLKDAAEWSTRLNHPDGRVRRIAELARNQNLQAADEWKKRDEREEFFKRYS